MRENIREINEHEAKKHAQPFQTNFLLEDLLENQSPKWFLYATLIVASGALIVAIIALLHSYQII